MNLLPHDFDLTGLGDRPVAIRRDGGDGGIRRAPNALDRLDVGGLSGEAIAHGEIGGLDAIRQQLLDAFELGDADVPLGDAQMEHANVDDHSEDPDADQRPFLPAREQAAEQRQAETTGTSHEPEAAAEQPGDEIEAGDEAEKNLDHGCCCPQPPPTARGSSALKRSLVTRRAAAKRS